MPHRRERNRASALEAYYWGKARRAELESQLLALKEEDAALRALAAMTELDTGTAGARWGAAAVDGAVKFEFARGGVRAAV